MTDRHEGSFIPDSRESNENPLDILRKASNITPEEIDAAANNLTAQEINNLKVLLEKITKSKKTDEKKAGHAKETEKKLVDVPIISSKGDTVGSVKCVEEKDRWIFHTIDIDAKVDVSTIFMFSDRLGVPDLENRLHDAGLWSGPVNFKLKYTFPEMTSAPRTWAVKKSGAPVPVDFSRELFGDWSYSGQTEVKIDKKEIPWKIELILK